MDAIKKFVENSNYYMVKYFVPDSKEDFGRIIDGEYFRAVNKVEDEIYRSIYYQDGNVLFVYDLKPRDGYYKKVNALELLRDNLIEARAIDKVYPEKFTWIFDGVSIKAYAIVPASEGDKLTTLGRYGGVIKFVKILRQHLRNIGKIHRGFAPDYSFLAIDEDIKDEELSVGSINYFNGMYSIPINLEDGFLSLIEKSQNNEQIELVIPTLDMKYWTREINPDFLVETKHIKLETPVSIEIGYEIYPEPIKRLMALKYKGNYNRFLLATFLLNVHDAKDAKFIYYSCLGEEEKEHNMRERQFEYILNNLKNYKCPTMRDLKAFVAPGDKKLSHPLEPIMEYIKNERSGS